MNVELREIATLTQRLLRPDQVALDETERDHARHRVEDAAYAGSLDDERAKTTLARVANARTRGDLRRAMRVVPGGAAPSGLVNALRGVSALWLAGTAVQFAIWTLISLIGFHWTEPWWLWTLVTGPFVAGPLWWLTETYYRPAPEPARAIGTSQG
ncbi:hypothetical protein GCM10023191_076750 [Actinoallomurus oryzae]|uniref:DUF1707 domain-containing protein n=1 Tax=Actinoallomurus oryzae TaxID=502180 RepID=A0ABP8QWJ4_9ACTN